MVVSYFGKDIILCGTWAYLSFHVHICKWSITVPLVCADDEVLSLREQNAKLRDELATLVFQQCLIENPPRQPLPDPRHPPPSTSQMLRQESAPSSGQIAAARTPSTNLNQSMLFRAPSNAASQMLSHAEQVGVAQSAAPGQQGVTHLMSQQAAEERDKFGLAISAKDERIKQLAEQLSAMKQTQKAECSSYQERYDSKGLNPSL